MSTKKYCQPKNYVFKKYKCWEVLISENINSNFGKYKVYKLKVQQVYEFDYDLDNQYYASILFYFGSSSCNSLT